jgi:VanZ family protein
MRHIKLLSGLNLLLLALIWTIILTVLSLISFKKLPAIKLPGEDKTAHFIFYFVLTLVWYIALAKIHKKKYLKFIIAIAVIIYGIIIEILQGLTNYRHADINDVFANTGGTFLALMFIYLLKFKNYLKKE